MSRQQPPICPIPQDFRYYMLRDNDVMVPMIPADQIAFGVPGVPRQLTHQQMSSECWKYLPQPASAPATPSARASSMHAPSPPTAWTKPVARAPDHQVRNKQYETTEPAARPSRWSHSPTMPVDSLPPNRTAPSIGTPEKAVSLTDRFAEIYPVEARRYGYQLPNPSGIEPDSSKKEFCTHWIRTGECDFTAIGCKYKHEMPDLPKLRELGYIQGLPRWWKEKLATVARGPTWIEQRRAAQTNGEDVDIKEEPPRREFDPSTFKRRLDAERDVPSDDIRQKRAILKREAGNERPAHQITSNVPQPIVRPAAPIHDLIEFDETYPLVDLDDTPAPPPSPQLSTASSASVRSMDTTVSYGSTGSIATPPATAELLIGVENTRRICKGPKTNQEVMVHTQGTRPRRDSNVSSSSTMSEKNERATPAAARPSKSSRDQKKITSKASKQVVETAKSSSGLDVSRHAGLGGPSTHTEQSKIPRESPTVQQDQRQQQQPRQRSEAGSPAKPRNKSSKKQSRARKFSATAREQVQGVTAKASTPWGKRSVV